MAVTIDSIQYVCDNLQRDIGVVYPGLSLYFIIHRQGRMRESIALAEHEIISHPAGNAARAIIRKHSKNERSSFLGIAIASESRMMGFKTEDHLLALFTINQDEFDCDESACAQIYHLAWHAIDLYEIRQEPTYYKKFKTGPMVPKRSPINLSKANLQADCFAAALAALKGDSSMLKFIDKKRGFDALKPIADFKAEDYPTIISMQACAYAIEELLSQPIGRTDQIKESRLLSLNVGQAFEQSAIQQWWNFAQPAQDMAWRGFRPEEILGAAMNTSDDPYVRSLSYLVQEVTELEASNAAALQNRYNAFVTPEVNMRLHHEMVDTVFEEALTQGMKESSGDALIIAANKQNQGLTEGSIIGWCANALQDAANAFDKALKAGKQPEQLARMQFEGGREKSTWEDLKKLGNRIVEKRRQGMAVTLGTIAEICHDHPAFAPVLNSIKVTLNDPSYTQALQASNDLAMGPSAPAPQPKGMEPKGPSQDLGPRGPVPDMPAPAPPGPSLGGKGRGAHIMRQRHLMAQKAKEARQGSTGDNSSGDSKDS